MKARDVMVSPVVTAKQTSSVRDIARLFIEHEIGAVPIVDDNGKLIGIVSETDLMHRAEAGTERRRSPWLRVLASNEVLAADYVKEHARKVIDIMMRDVITAGPDTPLHEIATLMERHRIKRVPILENGELVGIVSRANLVQAVASARKGLEIPLSDTTIRENLMTQLKAQPWAHTALINVTVTDGIVDLWGVTESETERNAIRVAAECASGVRAVNDNLTARRFDMGY